MSGKAPKYIGDFFRTKEKSTSGLVLRDDGKKVVIPFPRTDCFKLSFQLVTVEQSSGLVCPDLIELHNGFIK